MSVFIIAEAGVNHNGSLKLAKKLIDVASASGADAVKFQTFKAKNLVVQNSKKANYQKNTGSQKETQFSMLQKLELSQEMHLELINYSINKHIKFLSSPFDHESIKLLNDLGLEIFKILGAYLHWDKIFLYLNIHKAIVYKNKFRADYLAIKNL